MDQFIHNDYSSLGDFLFSLSGNEFAIIGAIVGFVLSQNLTLAQVNSVGNFFELVGQMMLSIAAQENVLSSQHTHELDGH